MLKFFFRLALFGLGLFLGYVFGGSALKTIWYRASAEQAEGRVIGFVAGRGRSIQTESTGVRKGKRRARRPAFTFLPAGATDSLTVKSNTGALLTFTQYELHEKVKVVYRKDKPEDAYIFGVQIIITQLLCLLLALYMIKIGITGRL